MYKLTYESDEDVGSVQTGDAKATSEHGKMDDRDLAVFDRSDSKPHDTDHKTPHNTERKVERSKTVTSTANAAFGINPKEKTNKQEPETTRRFYSLFNNDSLESIPTKAGTRRGPFGGCKDCLLVLYLLALTAGLIVSFVFLHQVTVHNNVLAHRVSYLESLNGGGNSGGQSPLVVPAENTGSYVLPAGQFPPMPFTPPIPDVIVENLAHPPIPDHNNENFPHPPPPPDSNDELKHPPLPASIVNKPASPDASQQDSYSCCNLVRRSVMDLTDSVTANRDEISNLERIGNDQISSTAIQFSDLTRRMDNIESRVEANADNGKKMEMQMVKLSSEIDLANGQASEALVQAKSSSADSGGSRISPTKATAFNAYHASMGMATGDVDVVSAFEITRNSEEGRTIFYNYELINRREDMDPTRGIFTVPDSGVYVFHVSFCTRKDTDVTTSVALARNNNPLRTFNVPLGRFSAGYETSSFRSPPVPLYDQASIEVSQHSYSVVSELEQDDEVDVKLLMGSIVEVAERTDATIQSCTRFSGFRIR